MVLTRMIYFNDPCYGKEEITAKSRYTPKFRRTGVWAEENTDYLTVGINDP